MFHVKGQKYITKHITSFLLGFNYLPGQARPDLWPWSAFQEWPKMVRFLLKKHNLFRKNLTSDNVWHGLYKLLVMLIVFAICSRIPGYGCPILDIWVSHYQHVFLYSEFANSHLSTYALLSLYVCHVCLLRFLVWKFFKDRIFQRNICKNSEVKNGY